MLKMTYVGNVPTVVEAGIQKKGNLYSVDLLKNSHLRELWGL